ncbi:aromatic ring-hydroxylating oxygenase subunit alpha [Nitrospirillum iridis]|uniref:Phenylpropionate dioxygenase-like ring-hydroxylating dioxygenase large terminal subunit n=1 Tax=Nitrospirillum iridis TaxID=765888 RepID=A0A7X0AYB4_9PROT|nr:aromatic ring-hydroxylating dioxygenase subunit alpha [Nitrospirillum iridis]MBB6252002.1 phenylpropionate dioxygenase-like ring-hydroxylating dioxygenase large terminal subunit [Nitrospirillum iridis]
MKHSFLNDGFFNGLDSSALGVEAAETLPPLCYTDRDFYEFEKEALFNHEWLCVGRESWVKEAGDYFTTSIIDEPIVVARGRDGAIRAMSSVCQHRAMLVAEGQGNTRAFLCPYHHWSYGLDGQLIGAPAMEKTCNFDKKDIKLPQFKVEIWHGFIFVNFDLDAAPLAPRLAALEGVMAPYAMAGLNGPAPDRDIKFPWNWKVMFENNNDGYHANRLHGGALHDFVPSRLAAFPDDLPADTAGYYRTNGTLHADASFNPTQKAILPIFPALGEVERNRMLFVNVPPTLSLVITSDMVIYLILRADGAETHLMDQGYLVAPGALEDPLFDDKLAMNKHSTSAIIAQDLHVDEMVQVGLRSRHAIRGRYSWQEQAQREFNGWLVRRYKDTWDRVKPPPGVGGN